MDANWIVIPVLKRPTSHNTIDSARHQARIQCQTTGMGQVIYQAVEIANVPVEFKRIEENGQG